MGKILVTASHWNTLCTKADKLLKDHGHEVIVHDAYMSFEDIAKVAGEINGAIIGLDNWTDEVFEIAPKLKVAAKFGVGTDNIDKDSATRHGVKVLNAPGINAGAVAELTVCFMVDLFRRVTEQSKNLSLGTWVRYLNNQLEGKTVGLLGFGAISREVTKRLQGFGVKILASDLYPNRDFAEKYNVKIVDNETILRESDIISIHIPSIPETYHMINDEAFAKMKQGAFLINCARGPLVDTAALERALDSGRISGAALDVYEEEPLPMDSPILSRDNVICTPHTAAETREVYENVSLCVAEGVVDVLEGRTPRFQVNR